MSNAKLLINAEQVALFVETNLTKPLAEIAAICALIAQSSDIASSSFASVFSGNIYIGLNDITKFNPNEALSNEPRNHIIRKLHAKAWYALEALIKSHYTQATASYFSDNMLNNQQRLKAMGCPNEENINKVLAELEGIQLATAELEALKTELNEMAEGDHLSKMKFKGGSFEDKAMLIAKLCNLRNRIENICQPVHFKKDVVPTANETYQKIVDLKNSGSNAETTIEFKCQVKIFNNGNIDLKLNPAYSTTAFSLSLQ